MIPVPGFEGRRVAVFGLGRSGLTAARALRAGGATPVLWDDRTSARMQAEAEGFRLEDLTQADWSDFAALVLSPGAPLTHPTPHWTVDKARLAKVEVIGDLELFARAIQALPAAERPFVIAVTGTNGKSTTTALIGWVLKQAGLTVHVGGNIGIGVLALPAPAPGSNYVIECSSYQLDLTTRFAPDVAILTNLSPDHLDRHGGMDGYVAAKTRSFSNQGPRGVALIGVDDVWGQSIALSLRSSGRTVVEVESTGSEVELNPDDLQPEDHPRNWIPGDRMKAQGRKLVADDIECVDLMNARSLPGRHNAQNAAFAYLAGRFVGLDYEAVVEALMTFPGLAHRMETVGTLDGVHFVNDSKATNADAARQALSSYDRVFWIAGGRAKAGGIDDLSDLFPRVAQAFLIGEAADDFARALGATPHVISGDMATAVRNAYAAARAAGGEAVVLLSPAAASFDQYPDFEARGEAFRAAVLNLGATKMAQG